MHILEEGTTQKSDLDEKIARRVEEERHETLTAQQQVSQEVSTIIAMATRIYEVGATYRSIEPDMFEVIPEDGANKATLMSAHQFDQTIALLHALKSASIMEVLL